RSPAAAPPRCASSPLTTSPLPADRTESRTDAQQVKSRTSTEASWLRWRRGTPQARVPPTRKGGRMRFLDDSSGAPTVAEALQELISGLLGPEPPVRIRCWDGSELGPPGAEPVIVVRSPDALRRLVWAPNELGLGRAYVAGDLDLEGDIYDLFALRDRLGGESAGGEIHLRLGPSGWWRALRAVAKLGALGPPPPPPQEEARLRGRRHDPERDAAAIAHHYDVGNDFYRLILGPTMTYSCAYWERPDTTLDEAQAAKYELVCRKLGLRP